MAIDRSYHPDISVVKNEEGNEIMIIEIKNFLPDRSEAKSVQLLREYMIRFFTKVGLLVTPDQTLIMRKTYLDTGDFIKNGYYSKFVPSELVFGDKIKLLLDEELTEYVYHKVVDLVSSINLYYTIPDYAKELSPDLDHLLENTQVLKRRT